MIASYQTKDGGSTSVYLTGFSYWKAAFLGIFLAAVSFALGYAIDGFLNKSLVEQYVYIGIPVLAVLFFSLFVINVMFIGRKTFLLLALSASSIAMTAGFFKNLENKTIIGGVVLIILSCIAGIVGKKEADNYLKIRFFKISNAIVSKAIFAISIFLAIVFFGILSKGPLDANNIILPQNVFDSMSGFVSKIVLDPATGGMDLSMSLSEISKQSTDAILKSQGINSMAQSEKNKISDELLLGYQQRLESVFGASIDPTKKLSSALYWLILDKVNSLSGTTRTGVFALISFLLFLTIEAFSPIIKAVSGVVSLLIYEFLMLIGFGGVVYESQSKESIILS